MLVSDTIKAIVPIIRDDVWGNDLFNSLSQKFNAGGGKVYPAIKYDPKTTDFSTKIIDLVNYATQAASEYPEKNVGIYMASFEEGTSILNGFSAVNGLMNVKWYGSSAYANNKTLLNDNIAMSVAIAHKLQCPIFGLDDAAKDKWQPFVDYLTTQLGRTPEVYALTAYDALCVIASSYMKFNVSNPDFTHLKSLFIDEANNYYGLTGRTTLNDAGDRAYADYDFWSLTNSPVSQWIRSATYQTSTGTLRRY